MAVQIHGVDRVPGPRVESPDRAENFRARPPFRMSRESSQARLPRLF